MSESVCECKGDELSVRECLSERECLSANVSGCKGDEECERVCVSY